MKNFWGVFFFRGAVGMAGIEKNETQLKKKDALQSLQKFVK